MAIENKWIVHLRGKDYPVYAGVLNEATKSGLKSLRIQVVQIPSPENGQLAVVLAVAEFEDGRIFEDVGDCSPVSTSPQLAAASLRLASTRAKGRVLRDAINVGQTMLEELPDLEDEDTLRHYSEGPNRSGNFPREGAGLGARNARAGGSYPEAPVVTPTLALTPTPALTVGEAEGVGGAIPGRGGVAEVKLECSNDGCEKPITKGQKDLSLRNYGRALCPACQKLEGAGG